MALLEAVGLTVGLPGGATLVGPLDLRLEEGEIHFLLGPSGAGKTLTLLAVAGLLPPGLAAAGEVRLQGEAVTALGPARRRELLGRRLALLPQEPRRALDPVRPLGALLGLVLRRRAGLGRRAAAEGVRAALAAQGLAPRVGGLFPHMLSGGMAQRALLGLLQALAPALLLLDEPTGALDPVRAAWLARQVREAARRGAGILWVSHDLGLAAALGDRALFLDGGRLLAAAPPAELLRRPGPPALRRFLAGEAEP